MMLRESDVLHSATGAAGYAISVVIPTAAGWPRVGFALEPLLPQLRAHGGQLIVADVSGTPPPAELRGAPDVVWLERPGEWVVRARRDAYDLAAADVVAITEDHCTVAPDWIERVLAAHAANPQAAAITGAVENGTRDHVAEWALYISAHLRLAPPISRRPALAGKTNISYKRAALARMPRLGPGLIEDVFSQQLRGDGLEVVGDDSIRVAHYQSGSALEMLELQYHNGRTLGGVRRGAMTATDFARALLPAPLAGFRLLRTLAAARGKRLPSAALASAVPLVAALYVAHAAGESLGYLLGPGDSPLHLH